jgi:hypothetical protein
MKSSMAAAEDLVQFPRNISTPHGRISITRIPDGRYALRNEKSDALIALVRNACRGKAQWNPRFRNWLIAASELQDILHSLGHMRVISRRDQQEP